MANLSQKKRQRMLEFIDKIREEHKDDDEMLIALGEIENELNSKKYGLVWEQLEEAVDVMMKDNIPVFTECKDKEIKMSETENYNFILEGDNLHSLHLLSKTHRNRVDIIYIDPPYNTSNSLTYDDKRIGTDDAFRHSKWLSFMSERLKIAKDLLNKDGLIFISIDDNEGYNLKVLCDEIFDEDNFMGSFSITKAEGGGQAKFIVKGHDLLLVYAKNLSETKPLARAKDIRGKVFEKDGEQYWIQEDAYRKVFGQYGNLHYEEILQYRDQEYLDEIDAKIKSGEIILLDKGQNGMHILGRVRKLSDDYSKYHSVMKQLNADGKNDLATFGLENLFDYPKPVNLIKELISGGAFLRPGKLTVLDFFAGSGTTGQAVLEFLKESKRDISFILCTNNEVSSKQLLRFVQSYGYLENYAPTAQTSDSAIEKKVEQALSMDNLSVNEFIAKHNVEYDSYGICQSVTLPRIKAVVNGFECKKTGKKILYRKKLSENNISKISNYLDEIEKIKQDDVNRTYKLYIDDSATLILETTILEGVNYSGIPANVKYYRTDFVSKDAEFVSDELLGHIKEMIQLEHGINLDGKQYVMILTDEDADELELKWDEYSEIKALYVSRNVLFTSKQNALFANVEVHIIPDDYFKFELQEVGEAW